ncbi:hypothetical protein KA005_55055 [bacterium]|nr:hypothetical protein [bacterium]
MKPPLIYLLTTTDNPYNPFTQWLRWYYQDLRLGHDTPGLLARLATSSEAIDDEANEAAMRDVVKYNFSGKHIMVTRDDPFFNQISVK